MKNVRQDEKTVAQIYTGGERGEDALRLSWVEFLVVTFSHSS